MLENSPTKAAAAKPGTGKVTASEEAGAKPAARRTAGALKPATRKSATGGAKSAALQAQIRQRAYELWERDGRPDGRDHAHWQQAEREIGTARAVD